MRVGLYLKERGLVIMAIKVLIKRKLPKDKEEIVLQKVSELLRDGIIRESTSPWRHQPFLVPKDGGKGWRMVVNYKPVNSLTERDAFPITTMQDILGKIGEAKIFSKVDFQQFYHQLPLV